MMSNSEMKKSRGIDNNNNNSRHHNVRKPSHPWENANIVSRLFFWWVTPMIRLGNQRALKLDDLYKVIPEDRSKGLGLELQKEWMNQISICNKKISKNQKPSFARTLFQVYGSKFVLPGLQIFLEECIIKIAQPLCLSQLINYFNNDNTISIEEAYLYATGVVFCSVAITFNTHSMCFTSNHIGMRTRVATCSLIFRKSLTLSQEALCKTDIGQMVNLISNDVARFDQVFGYLHSLWVGPLQICIATFVLYYHNIGIASLVLFVIMSLLVPLQLQIGKMFSQFRREAAQKTDDRIRIINEIIPAMRAIKMYAWEKAFLKLTQFYRRLEMGVIRRTSYLRAFNVTLSYVSSKLFIFPTLVVFALTRNELTPSKVFLIVAIINNVRTSMPGYFSIAIQMVAEAMVSFKRIQDFLLLDEMKSNEKNTNGPCRIEFNKVTVSWPVITATSSDNIDSATLTNISFKINSGQLLTVIGPIGSGKSTLLNTILGELRVMTGNAVVEGRIAYCSQEPWIITGTIRQNILCGNEMDLERYLRVIRATSLEEDFNQLPRGDASIIGEGGISLSGGQKARVNLARCLYVDADIYLLDDPLSAIDARVSAHIFQEAIQGLLHGKIRVLVTHQLQYLKGNDQVLVLKSGQVEFNGAYCEFKNSGVLEKIVDYETNEAVLVEESDIAGQTWSDDPTSCRIRRVSLVKYARRQSQSSYNAASLRGSTNHGKSMTIRGRRSIIAHIDDSPAHYQNIEALKEIPTFVGVKAKVYWEYFRSGGSIFHFILFTFSCITAEILFCASNYWLNLWTRAERERYWISSNSSLNYYNSSSNGLLSEEPTVVFLGYEFNLDTDIGIYIYSALVGGVFIFGYSRAAQFYSMSVTASINLHDNMFQAVLRAPIQFYDKNPVGRIVNRFSKDTGSMDDMVPTVLFDLIWLGLNTLGVLLTVAVVKYWLLLPALILFVVFYFIRRSYLRFAIEIKRLEATAKSPVFTQLYSSLIGLTTLRAHNYQPSFQREFDRYQDIHSSAWFLYFSSARWLGIWMDLIVTLYVACVTYACVMLRDSLSGSEAGLIISSAMSMARFQYCIRQSAEMENQMTSVDRIIEYGQLPPEALLDSNKSFKPPSNWPSAGAIQLSDLTLRYSPTDPPVLKNLKCTIKSREKIGIVGRSGAGKSSVIAALFRLIEPEGEILIDGIDTKLLYLHDLRSRISIIPQEPILFYGSLRFNLDPLEEFGDDVIWAAVKDVHLDVFMMSGNDGLATNKCLLDFQVADGGTNLSVGQSQLICLARAILRNNRILVLDEATASVDQETDTFIQMVIREKFRHCTVLTIAHRLNTIIDSDKVMVLDAGQISELDEPSRLLSNTSGLFYNLVEQSGPQVLSELVVLAKKASKMNKGTTNGYSFAEDGYEDDTQFNLIPTNTEKPGMNRTTNLISTTTEEDGSKYEMTSL